MPRALWKGAISFGLVTVPVGLYAATERAAEVRFRLLHARDASPIDYRRVCEAEGVEVPWAEIARGYEHERGQYVIVTDEDFARVRAEATHTFEIRDFVPGRAIGVLHFDQPYYLAPDGKSAAKAYALLRDALARTERAGVGTIVLRQRERLAALLPLDGALALVTLRFATELRAPMSLDLPAAGRGWDAREMKLTHQLIEALAADWDPARYRDTYREGLLEVIERKVKGDAGPLPRAPKRARVVNLVKALEESLKAGRRPAARAAGRRTAGRRPRQARRAA
jgi:DNA end-binding protein Ku